ncbi:hypothetical protein [Mucilaginibacter sp.]
MSDKRYAANMRFGVMAGDEQVINICSLFSSSSNVTSIAQQ